MDRQIGFNARATLNAVHAAEAGACWSARFPYPFGYYAMFENGSFCPTIIERDLSRIPQTMRISHKHVARLDVAHRVRRTCKWRCDLTTI